MKILSALIMLFCATAATAKSLEITVPNVHNDKGRILVMATVPGQEKPVYGMASAKQGTVVVRLDSLQTDAIEILLFHDQDGDYQIKMGDRGPAEGYATRKCKLTEEHTAVNVNLLYPLEN